MTREKAEAFIKSLINLRTSATDPQAVDAPAAYPEWKAKVEYAAGDRILYNDILYKVLQSHTSQTDWAPDVAPSLFTKVLIPDENIIPEWEQPESTNPYMKGDKVSYKGNVYESIVDNNVWAPDVCGWEIVK